jgi:hypothetical protein
MSAAGPFSHGLFGAPVKGQSAGARDRPSYAHERSSSERIGDARAGLPRTG